MDIFGEKWQNYWDKVKTDWQEKVSDDDIVLMAGDFSWAMRMSEALSDFALFDGLKLFCAVTMTIGGTRLVR